MKVELTILMFFFVVTVQAQTTNQEDYLEQIVNAEITEIDYQTFSDQLESLKRNPVMLNHANASELSSILFLDQIRIAALIDYRQKFGAFTDWEELYRIPGFSNELVEQLKPYTTLQNKVSVSNWRNLLTQGSFSQTIRVTSLLKKQQGYYAKPPASFPVYDGDRLKFYNRWRYQLPGKFSFCLINEKDPGEKLFTHQHPYSADFTSAHLFLKPSGKLINTLVIGDYNFTSGLGLVFSNGFGVFKSAQTMQVYQSFNGIQPYTSVNESSFLRGAAISLGRRKVGSTLLFSNKKIDSTLNKDSSEISSIYTSGLHRTNGELRRRKNTDETVVGINIHYNSRKIELAANALVWQRRVKSYRKLNGHTIGLSTKYQLHGGTSFTEIAIDNNQQMAAVLGVITTISPKMSVSIVNRNYSSRFTNPVGSGFGHSARNQNERGTYFGLEYQLSGRWKLTSYLDQYVYPEPSFYTQFPAHQKDVLGQLSYTRKKKFSSYLRLRWQLIQKDDKSEEHLTKSYSEDKLNIRLHAEIILSSALGLKFRIERVARSVENAQPGWLIFQDVSKKDLFKKIDLTARLAYFSTTDYGDRIYAFENDVPGSFSIPAYSGQGIRYYILLNYPISKRLKCWFRYNNWIYNGVNTIGSGNDATNGNTKPEISFQLSYRLN